MIPMFLRVCYQRTVRSLVFMTAATDVVIIIVAVIAIIVITAAVINVVERC